MRLPFPLVGLLTLLLAACGSPTTEPSRLDTLRAALGGAEPDFAPRFAALIAARAPALQVGFIDKEVSTTLLLEQRRNGIETWLSPEGAALVLERGMLHGTRGFGTGLLASELSEPLALVLARQGGRSDRLMTYLDGNDRAVTRTFRCVLSSRGARQLSLQGRVIPTTLMQEDCKSLDQSFRNLYWVAQSGIVQSRQWAGGKTGEISTRVVLR
ncbi:YjbF family lipoprotein [Sulfitobacter aestuarii]|uniref:YjbF family lipoprotein n=1 Tax=Sulfitobacter aestuarii TaxID=2161676 RepID=A0ABW5UAK9_9RHOB